MVPLASWNLAASAHPWPQLRQTTGVLTPATRLENEALTQSELRHLLG